LQKEFAKTFNYIYKIILPKPVEQTGFFISQQSKTLSDYIKKELVLDSYRVPTLFFPNIIFQIKFWIIFDSRATLLPTFCYNIHHSFKSIS